MRAYIPLVAAVLLIPAAAPAQAQTERVGYGDLNLAIQQGQLSLHRRISGAIGRLCDDPGSKGLASLMAQNACRREAWNQTLPKIEQLLAQSDRIQLAERTSR